MIDSNHVFCVSNISEVIVFKAIGDSGFSNDDDYKEPIFKEALTRSKTHRGPRFRRSTSCFSAPCCPAPCCPAPCCLAPVTQHRVSQRRVVQPRERNDEKVTPLECHEQPSRSSCLGPIVSWASFLVFRSHPSPDGSKM